MEATPTPAALERGLDRLPPIFAACLGMADERSATVFALDGFVYATNGRLCVRMPEPEGWDVPNPGRLIDRAPQVFRGEFRPDPIPFPAIEVVDCPCCLGTRFCADAPCSDCDQGDVYEACNCPKCDGSHPCTHCDGKGTIPLGPCRACQRSGVAGGVEGVEVAPRVWVAERYLMILARHGARLFLPASGDVSAYGLDPDRTGPPLRFAVGAVEGRLMPMDPEVCEYESAQAARGLAAALVLEAARAEAVAAASAAEGGMG